jgi:hypothetical protein
MTSLGAPASMGTNLGALTISLEAPRITVEQSMKNNNFIGSTAGVAGKS